MVKVKNGRLVASNISFALPEGFSLTLKPTGCGVHLLQFESKNELINNVDVYIDVEFDDAELTAQEAMEDFVEDFEMKVRGDFKPITRGKGTAIAAHYYGSRFSEMYEERYDFPRNSLNQNQVAVSVQLMANNRKVLKKSINEVLEMPTVKAFLDSVEYF